MQKKIDIHIGCYIRNLDLGAKIQKIGDIRSYPTTASDLVTRTG